MALPDRTAPPRLQELETRETPAVLAGVETFDQAPAFPVGWVAWSNDAISLPSVQAGVGVNNSAAVVSPGSSRTVGYSWQTQSVNADTGASASIFADSLVPALVIARGQNLDSNTPSYLAAVVTRGLTVELWQVTAGQITVLASLSSPSSTYVSRQWVKVSLVPTGTNATITVSRQDTGQFLNSQGQWQATETTAISAKVAAQSGDGLLGMGRAARYAGTVKFDNFALVPTPTPTPTPTSPPPASPPATSLPLVVENFNNVVVGTIPNTWTTWSSSPTASFQAAAPKVSLPTNSIASNSPLLSNAAARAWVEEDLGANVDVAASVYLDSLISAQVFARGTNLATRTPTYYAVTITRGLQASLVKVQDGVSTTLATIRSTAYFSGQWVRVNLIVEGDRIRVTITRQDTGQYLQSNGTWGPAPNNLFDLRDGSITAAGRVGVARAASVAGAVSFDDFEARALAPVLKPTVAVQAVGTLSGLSFVGSVAFVAKAHAGSSPLTSLEFKLNGETRFISTNRDTATWTLDTRTLANGKFTLTVRVVDSNGCSALVDLTFLVNNAATDPLPKPTAPSHYDHIRIAMLAYSGTPMGEFEQSLLRTSVDLVIPNSAYLATIDGIAPDTPQIIYTNLSNTYGTLLTDWLNYADANGLSREDAFYHVAQATTFSGSSPSSQPVSWFWNVSLVSTTGTDVKDLTKASRGTSNTTTKWGSAGQAMVVGYTDEFREINVNVTSASANGWAGVWEYATRNSQGQTVWKTLTILKDGTAGLTQKGPGTITFDPPADWVATAAKAGDPAYLYVRFRVTNGTEAMAPITASILGRDYVRANGGQTGTIPAFDSNADTNGDGYLNDAEYARRAAGKDARFLHESRLFYPNYGQMRFVTNPSSTAVAAWAVDYHLRFLARQPLADGLFIDNSSGHVAIGNIALRESSATFNKDYALLVDAVSRAVSPKWVVSNTVGGRTTADATTAASSAAFEEFLLRPLVTNWSKFNDVVELVARRLAAPGSPYLIMDSLPYGGSPTDPRTQLATLAYYYLLADPERTFLMFYGGDNPASSWTEHWSPAVTVDIGQPVGAFTTLATGKDPTNSALTYKVFGRQYTDGLVVYKPLSYNLGKGEGTTADSTQTLVPLNGSYKVVNADGSVSAKPVTSVWLRNGEGVVLVKA